MNDERFCEELTKIGVKPVMYYTFIDDNLHLNVTPTFFGLWKMQDLLLCLWIKITM